MFIYLNICPFDDSVDEFLSDESQKARKLWFNSWTSFYTDLFTQPADQVILTLNRMMKTKTSQDKHGRLRAVKLLKRITSLLSLQFEEIQGLLHGKKSGNESKIPTGECFSVKDFSYLLLLLSFRKNHNQPSRPYHDTRPQNISISIYTIL